MTIRLRNHERNLIVGCDDSGFSDRYANATFASLVVGHTRRARRGPPSPGGRTSGASRARGREGRPAAAASAAMAQTLSEWASGRVCDWCQEVCDLDASDLNVLTCSFRGCPSQDSDDNNSVYHKECVEAYLKSSMERGSAKYVPRPRRRRVVVARESSDPRTGRTPLNSRRLPRSRA